MCILTLSSGLILTLSAGILLAEGLGAGVDPGLSPFADIVGYYQMVVLVDVMSLMARVWRREV